MCLGLTSGGLHGVSRRSSFPVIRRAAIKNDLGAIIFVVALWGAKGTISSVESGDSTDSKATRAISQSVPGPFFLRYYPDHRLMAWQPQGTLDDLMLDQITEWLVHIEKAFLPFKRFVDFSRLTTVAVRTGHVFNVARRRAEQFREVEPVRTALFSEDWVAFGIARLYELLMENTLIEARAFRDLAEAAEWLAIPVDVLTLKDEPVPHIGNPKARTARS